MREGEGENLAQNHKERHHQPKEESFCCLSNTVALLYFTCIAITVVVSLELILNDTNVNFTNDVRSFKQKNVSTGGGVEPPCDLFRGRWLPDPNASLYTNITCMTMQPSKNCLLNGRNNTDYLNWRWKPDECELPRFDPNTFFSILRGKTMAFVGDSLARNQVESLVCILSTVETPYVNKRSKEDHNDTIWEFPEHKFTLAVFWSQYLVAATEIPGTFNFDVQLDRVHANWSSYLPSVDYIVFSASHWFFRENNLYRDGRLIGCTYCDRPGTAAYGPDWAIRMALRAAFRAVNACENCKKIVGFVRTYSPAHFENGSWDSGGYCNRTRPIEREEADMALPDWGYSRMQVEEEEMARIEGKGKGNVFDFLDVTEMMATRVDGHPGRHGDWKDGSDCLHWCLPGPIDTWNGLLLERIKRLDSTSSPK